MMCKVRYPYRGAVNIWRDTSQNHTFVMFFAYSGNAGEANWGVNPDFLLDIWKFNTKKVSIDLVPPVIRREQPDMGNLINRSEFMKIMNRRAFFDVHHGFYKILCRDVQIDRTTGDHGLLEL